MRKSTKEKFLTFIFVLAVLLAVLLAVMLIYQQNEAVREMLLHGLRNGIIHPKPEKPIQYNI